MTLAQPVKDAIAWADEMHGNPQCAHPTYWQTIRAELHRLAEIADGINPLVVRLHEVTTRLEAANALLRECVHFIDYGGVADDDMAEKIDAHLQGAGDEADRHTPEQPK